MPSSRQGFTLIELLVVIAIIGLLATMAMSALNNARVKARETKRASDIRQIANAFMLLADDNNGVFPTTGGIGRCLGTNGTCWNGNLSGSATLNAELEKFLSVIPKDPSGRSGKGDRYVYADLSANVAWHCTGTSYPTGPYILWLPETLNPTNEGLCKNMGFYACCGSSVPCAEGYYCAYKIQ